MADNSSIGPLPPLVRDPSILSAIVRKRVRRAPSRPIGWPYLPEQAAPDIPESMEALSEEIQAARPTLDNLHEDIGIFTVRDEALDEVLRLLVKMKDRLKEAGQPDEQVEALRADIEAMIAEIDRITSAASHRAVPLLRPFERAAALPAGILAAGSQVELVFVVPRAERMRRDFQLLARNAREFGTEFANRGLTVRYGLMTYGRDPHPFVMRESYEDFAKDIRSIEFADGPENALQALQDSLWRFSFRPDARRVFVILSDMDSADDMGGMREEIISLLRDDGVTVYALSANDPYTRLPHAVYEDITRATGGKYYNIDSAPYEEVIGNLLGDIIESTMKQVPTTTSIEREMPLGPEPGDTFRIRLPDLRPGAFGLDTLPLKTADDFVAALGRVDRVLFFASHDRAEKSTLSGFLYRVLDHFHNTRANWLNFWI